MLKPIKQVIEESKEPTTQELYDELKSVNDCFVCGEPLTSDDIKLRGAGETGAHLKCFEQWNDERRYKIEHEGY